MTKQDIVQQLEKFLSVEQTEEIQQQINQLEQTFNSLKEKTIQMQKSAFDQLEDAVGEFVYKNEDEDISFQNIMSTLSTKAKEILPLSTGEEISSNQKEKSDNVTSTNEESSKEILEEKEVSVTMPAKENNNQNSEEPSTQNDTSKDDSKPLTSIEQQEVVSVMHTPEIDEDTPSVIEHTVEEANNAIDLVHDQNISSEDVIKDSNPAEDSKTKVDPTQDNKAEPKKQTKEESFAKRQQIIKELETIIDTDVKNLSKNFKTANKLQDRWKATTNYRTDEFKELENQYKLDLDKFYASAKIVKDAIELDYNRNKQAKDRVIEKIKTLTDETDARHLEQKIRQYEKEWYRVGPVKKEIRDESRKQLDEAVATLQPLLDKLYEGQKEVLSENLKKKINICEQLNAVLGKEFKTPKQFQIASDRVIQLQKDWREIGRSDENDRIWEVFRTACDNFFNAKRDFFKNLADNRKENKERKLELIKKAEELKESDDWNKTSDVLINLQKEWKKVGPAHPAEDQKLWVRFRSACDVFFNARSENFKSKNKEQVENLKMKEALVQQVKEFKPKEDIKETIKELQQFEKQYNAIGFVPFKSKDKIHEEFYGVLNGIYDKLNIDRNQKAKMRFQNRIKSMASGNNAQKTLSFEERKVKERIAEIKKQLASYDQNISFVSGGADNPLVKGIKKNIRDAERELESLTMQLNLLKDAKSGKLNFEEE